MLGGASEVRRGRRDPNASAKTNLAELLSEIVCTRFHPALLLSFVCVIAVAQDVVERGLL